MVNPDPPPRDTEWVLRASGYRIGILPRESAVVVEVLEYHPGYLVLDRADLERLRGLLEKLGPGEPKDAPT
jgi:hypothetical protein